MLTMLPPTAAPQATGPGAAPPAPPAGSQRPDAPADDATPDNFARALDQAAQPGPKAGRPARPPGTTPAGRPEDATRDHRAARIAGTVPATPGAATGLIADAAPLDDPLGKAAGAAEAEAKADSDTDEADAGIAVSPEGLGALLAQLRTAQAVRTPATRSGSSEAAPGDGPSAAARGRPGSEPARIGGAIDPLPLGSAGAGTTAGPAAAAPPAQDLQNTRAHEATRSDFARQLAGSAVEAGGGGRRAVESAAPGSEGLPLPAALGMAPTPPGIAAAAMPTAEARLPAPPGSAEFGPQISTQVVTFVREGVEHAQLQLNPAEMGPVSVQIQLDGATARVHLSAENPQTRQALEQAMPQLAGSLREAGLTLTGGGVFEQPRQGNNGNPDPDRGPGRRSDPRDPADPPVASVSRSTAPARRGVVDLVA